MVASVKTVQGGRYLGEQIVIKKYSNRRLYDTLHKRYVTLEEISNLIKEGNEIRVIDSQTNEDITKVILIQAILESEKNKEDILPASFLHMLIKYGNKVARDFFENYFLMMFQAYLSFQESMKKNLSWWQEVSWFPPGFKLPLPKSPLQEVFKNNKAEEKLQEGKDTTKIGEPLPSTLTEIESLRERIRELEERVKSISISKGKRSKEKSAG